MSITRFMLCLLLPFMVNVCVSATEAGAEEAQLDPNRPIKDKWAVVIGVSKFSNADIPQLRYPAKDAQDFCNFLVAKENFARDHVLLLTDEKATKVRILEAFGDGWLPQRVMRDDLVLVFISTHGSPADKSGENFIIAHDSDPAHPYATGIRLQDLSRELSGRTGCDRLVLLLDACHSGAAVAESKGITRAPSNFNLDAIAGTGQLVISSSKSDQVSWESKRYPNGVFTAKLMQALEAQGKQTTLDDAFKHLRNGVETEVRFDRMADQTPVMLDKWTGTKLALAAPALEPRRVLQELPDAAEEAPPVRKSSPPPTKVQSNERSIPAIQNVVPQVVPPASRPPIAPAIVPPIQNSLPSTIRANSSPVFMTTSWLNSGGDTTLESGTRLLDESEVRKLPKKRVTCLYNEAYARHGRGFSTPYIREYFRAQSWYREDPDYHWRPDDARVMARKGGTDDGLVVNVKRTPKQWANMQLLKRFME